MLVDLKEFFMAEILGIAEKSRGDLVTIRRKTLIFSWYMVMDTSSTLPTENS